MLNTSMDHNIISKGRGRGSKSGLIVKVAVALAVVLALSLGVLWYVLYTQHQEQQVMVELVETEGIYPNIYINEVDVAGLSKDGALSKLNDTFTKSLNDKKITLAVNGREAAIAFEEISAHYDFEAAVDLAYDYARQGETPDRAKLIEALEEKPFYIEAQYSYDESLLSQKLQAFADEIYVAPVNATIDRINGQFVTTEEVVGLQMQYDSALAQALELASSKQGGTIQVQTEELPPEFTLASFEGATALIGTFSTTIAPGSAGRNMNIETAADKINDYVLYPEEVFSTNATFGAMTHDNGYRMAPVIIGGELIDDMGGGICQVSSTLYMAVLYAELEIVERQNHSQKVGYMDYGFDATLAGDYIDFKFKNDTAYPVFIESIISGNKLTVNIYGYEIHSPDRRLEFYSTLIETVPPGEEKIIEDPDLPLGERVMETSAKNGQKYNLYKVAYENNVEVSRDQINLSYYRPKTAVVRLGTGEALPEQPETPVQNGVPSAEPPTTAEDDALTQMQQQIGVVPFYLPEMQDNDDIEIITP